MGSPKISKSDLSNIAIVGSGPTALFLLKYILENIEVLRSEIKKITIFEKEEILGMGMPYHPKTTDIYNLANISSEEIPMLQESFGDWLRRQNSDALKKLNVTDLPIDDSEVYSRVSLGHYFEEQFKQLISSLESKGIQIFQKVKCEVLDVSKDSEKELTITDCHNEKHNFSTVVIANGHEWKGEDKPESGYYASPWPIHKLIPQNKEGYNFPVGTLGASLSAFDVVTSLAHRHGTFSKVNEKLTFKLNEANPKFKLVLHSSEGWLPHLQYEQKEPIREIFRHFTRNQLLDLIDENGFLRIEDYFDHLCRPALIEAFRKDRLTHVVDQLQDSTFSFKDLVALMSEKHDYVDSFEGMKKEMVTARNSINHKIPIYWMETLDDLMYSLNYHAELLPAEDHLFFHKEIMSFLMNVIAALPLQSADILLALYDANCIELKAGYVNFPEDAFQENKTKIVVESADGNKEEVEYQLFVNCGGGKKLELEDFPFQTLVKQGVVRPATAPFAEQNFGKEQLRKSEDHIVKTDSGLEMKLSGIQIDSSYRTINKDNSTNSFLYDINFTHTNGLRPYSYGLQACSATSLILVESWLAEIKEDKNVSEEIETITELYEDIDGL
ncbi:MULTISPECIES: FAD/NAD(P)-binding protein [unclassified Kaistella]|uniref:FAD/NAD(P)-binding protein n=1 Tax=unclassified Kaistella TaxID=2762626 RepID=UPI00273595D8|nr:MULTISPECIES: FAD/NAD(P)-binding protein [unclassified Kaistella]MDP2455256.1 FAD/NAD(P)-binding protein [Kaistella sp. SH11-4b]MDP2458194.1 FAD/NAD(P)-binding protein [Kaistella sp. SH40-3]MDP2461073.1 FAD/NAD(P)-binding protein [Kaistella sp. SH19-2b]